jgi:hypothetical protein
LRPCFSTISCNCSLYSISATTSTLPASAAAISALTNSDGIIPYNSVSSCIPSGSDSDSAWGLHHPQQQPSFNMNDSAARVTHSSSLLSSMIDYVDNSGHDASAIAQSQQLRHVRGHITI